MILKNYNLEQFYKRINYQGAKLEKQFKYFFAGGLTENDHFLTLENEGEIIALCQLKKLFNNDLLDTGTIKYDYVKKFQKNLSEKFINKYSKEHYTLVFLTIKESYRGKGLMKKILEYVFKYIKTKKQSFINFSYFSTKENESMFVPKLKEYSKKYKVLIYVSNYGFIV